ncbi:MAG: hypothetical protein M3Y86_02365, partial [Verrucomicrobiota bacterium]|nr:hypothetical protein [Verrucomicrobiota bacterium]
MKKPPSPESGFSKIRTLLALLLATAACLLAIASFATPNPMMGTLSTSTRALTYTDPVGSPPNLTGFAGALNCGPNDSLCSVYTLTIDPSVGQTAAGYDPTKQQIRIVWSWTPAAVDNDIFITDASETVVLAKNQSTADPSTIVLPATFPAGTYKLILVLSTGAPVPYTTTINLEPAPVSPPPCNPGDENCAPPRFQSYPAGPGQADNAGEPSLGVDWNPGDPTLKDTTSPDFTTGVKLKNTGGVALFTSGNNEYRVNFDDCPSPAVYNWEDVSALSDQQFVLSDPIGFVDHYTNLELGLQYPPVHTPGRGFAIDLLGGQGNSIGAFSDDDFNTSLPGGTGGPGAGPDHQTLGGGPYSGTPPVNASYPATTPQGATKNAIYYCSQNIVAESQCSRSDDGGQTFGPAVPIFNPTTCTGGITGHVKVGPDGTVYVPNSSCGTTGTAGVAVSTDNGLTWTENNVPNSTSSQDPYVAIGQNNVGKAGGQATNTIYLAYTDGDGHAKAAFSHNRGVSWSTPADVGAPFGVTHAVFPIAAAGDDNRASVAFVGTGDGIPAPGSVGGCDPYGTGQDANGHDSCANIWHLYVATTYNGGQSWITTDATPDDPIQEGAVCLQGTTCLAGRNLLDFNDMAIDAEGRILAGYADGCVNCSNTFSGQSGASHGTVTRQSGGRRLFAHFDPNPAEPKVPAAPQLVSAVSQPTGGVLVTWLEPDNGGSPITGYKIYRGTASGQENPTPIATVSGSATRKYFDSLMPPPPAGSNLFYYVTAVNAQGTGTHCGEVSLVPPGVGGGNSCTFPYLNVDSQGSPGPAVPTDPTQGELTIQFVNIGEPFTTCTDNSITFIMKVATLDPAGSGMATVPPNSEYQILFTVKDTNGNPQKVFVDMDTNGAAPTPEYSYGRRDASATGGSFDTTQCTNDGTPLNTCPA